MSEVRYTLLKGSTAADSSGESGEEEAIILDSRSNGKPTPTRLLSDYRMSKRSRQLSGCGMFSNPM